MKLFVQLVVLPASVQGGLMDGLSNMMGTPQQPGVTAGGALAPDATPQEMRVDPTQTVASEEAANAMDLYCVNNTQAQIWFNIQNKFQYVFGVDSSFNAVDPKTLLEPVLYSIMEDMSQIPADVPDDCGVGKLMIQLLSITASDDGENIGRQVHSNEKLTSPILTLLLDMPWTSFALWPVFGVMSQMSMRRVLKNTNSDSVDGLGHPNLREFIGAMNFAIINGDSEALKGLAQSYIDIGADGIEESPIGFLTSVLTQSALAKTKQESHDLFVNAQRIFKQMVYNPKDLDTMLSTRWPLWGMAHLASLRIMSE